MSRDPLRLGDYLGHILEAISQIREHLAGNFFWLLQIPVKVFMGSNCLKVDQFKLLADRVAQQVKLSLASEFINIQSRQVTFFLVPNLWRSLYGADCRVYICSNVVMQLFILTSKSASLNCLIASCAATGLKRNRIATRLFH